MDAKEYFKRGREYLEKDDYSRAIADFWKAMEMTHGNDKAEMLREKFKEANPDPDVLALFLMETLKQVIG